MSVAGPSAFAFASAGPVGPEGFALLTWGSILVVVVAFGYLVRTLLLGERSG